MVAGLLGSWVPGPVPSITWPAVIPDSAGALAVRSAYSVRVEVGEREASRSRWPDWDVNNGR